MTRTMKMAPETQQTLKHVGDGVAYLGVVATLTQILPAIAAGLSVIWIAMQITEKLTGRSIPHLIRCMWLYFRTLIGK